MMYASQIGTVTSAGGSGFTAFRGLHEIKTSLKNDVKRAVCKAADTDTAKSSARRVVGRKASPAKKKSAAKPKSKVVISASARKVEEESSDSEWDPDA